MIPLFYSRKTLYAYHPYHMHITRNLRETSKFGSKVQRQVKSKQEAGTLKESKQE